MDASRKQQSARPSMVPPRQRTTLRRKFVLTMLVVSVLIGATTLAIVLTLSSRSAERRMREVETAIEEGITSKGKVLTENHALALRTMVLDNAFLDMQSLLKRAVQEDPDLVYGLFTDAKGDTLALERRGAANGAGPTAPSQPGMAAATATNRAEQNAGERPTTTPAAKDAWKELGFRSDELSVSKTQVGREKRLGQELVEVAVPIFGEEKELLGTIRYGLSTSRMRRAIAEAQADAKAQQLRSVVLIGGTVTLATLMGILLSRLQAVRITRPVQELTQAATDLARGDRSVRVKIGSGDELEQLGFSFNRMVWELGSSYEQLEDLNRNLEHKVKERTQALASRNQDMRAVLDNVDQGLIMLTPEGVMATEHSAVVDKWFGASETSQPLWQYLAATSPTFARILKLGWDQIVADFLPLEVSISVLPKRLTTGTAQYDFRYLPLLREEKLHSVLVVIADVTNQLQLEREEAESRELTEAFRRLSKDRNGFLGFLSEANALFDAIVAAGTEGDRLKRALHTLKGSASSMGLSVIARLCHQLEEQLATTGEMAESTLAQLQQRWRSLNEDVAQLAPSRAHLVEVPESEHAELTALLERTGQMEALRRVLSWKLEPATRSLSRLAEQAQALAQRLGKAEVDVLVNPSSVRLDSALFGPLFCELSHVVRNAVDHGLESPDERSTVGKTSRGQLTFDATQEGDFVTIEVGDDGRGIDWEAIRAKARALGLPNRTDAELVDVLCHEGFSSRSEVTETSGRGVGMAAVKKQVDAMGGRIAVRSTLGQGTTWTFRVPLRQGRQVLCQARRRV